MAGNSNIFTIREEQKCVWNPLPEDISLFAGLRYQTFLEALPRSSKRDAFLRKFYQQCFDFFEKYFDAKISIIPPLELVDVKPELWHMVHYASCLQKARILALIERVPGLNDEPRLFRFRSVIQGEEDHSFHGIGHSLFSEQEAFLTSIGEAVERYCFKNFSPPVSQLYDAIYGELRQQALDPLSVVGISDELRKANVHPHIYPFDEKTAFRWVKGWSLTKARRAWIPLQLVTATASLGGILHQTGEPLLRLPISTGAAAGTAGPDAVYRGICEIVERDAYMITYLNRISPPKIHIGDFQQENFTFVTQQFEKHNLDLHLLALPTDVPCHVIMAVVLPREKSSPYFALGMKADIDIRVAVMGAIREALNSRIAYRFMLQGVLEETIPSPEEKDRIGQYERVYLWQTRPELLDNIKFLWQGEYEVLDAIPVYQPSPKSPSEKLAFLLKHFKRNQIDVFYLENSTPDIYRLWKESAWGLRSFFVVIPTFQPMHLRESVPYFSGDRLKSVPRRLDYSIDDSINTFPHPLP